jgi:GNAT superfamily N-acetyltransferase
MPTISSRLYEGEKDFQIMIDLLNKIRPASHADDFPVKVNIEENLAVEEIRANTKLWFDGDQPIGWAYVDDSHNLLWELEKQCTEPVGAEMVAWGEECTRSDKTLAAGESSTLDASCREDFSERLDFLSQHGFHQTEVVTVHMKRNLSEPISEFELPQGFQIRSVKGIKEAEAIASTHRAAFGTDYMTTENRLVIMNTSEYDPSLDLVVVAPDGTIAAYCTCSVNEQNKEGWTDPVATHPNYQRKGFAKVLLIKGMQMLKERGMKSAKLGTSGDNIAMQKTAESVGFFLEHRVIWFEKEIR